MAAVVTRVAAFLTSPKVLVLSSYWADTRLLR